MTMNTTRAAVPAPASHGWTWPHSVGGWWAVGISAAALLAWVAIAVMGWWAMALAAAGVTLVALCVDIGCLWRWDDSSLDLLAAGSTALVAVILIAALVGTLGTMRLG